MIKSLRAKSFLFAAALLTIGIIPSKGRAAFLELSPDISTIQSGVFVNVSVILGGMDNDVDVSVFDFDITFDQDVLQFTGISHTSQLGAIDGTHAESFSGLKTDGTLNVSVLSLLPFNGIPLPTQDNPLSLATITFVGKSKGIAELGFSLLATGTSICDSDGNAIEITSLKTATITNVPEPPVIMLSMVGLVSLLFFGVRRKR